MENKVIHNTLLKKAKEAEYKNIELEQINHQYESFLIDFYLRRATLEKLAQIEIKEEELQKIYEENRNRYMTEIKASLDTIFLKDKATAEEILEKVNTKNFEEYKEKYDEKAVKDDKTLSESLPLSQIQPQIAEIIFTSNGKKGVLKKIAETQDGFHIIYLKDREEAREATFEEARNALIEELRRIFYNQIYNDTINSIINEERKLENNDSINEEKK